MLPRPDCQHPSSFAPHHARTHCLQHRRRRQSLRHQERDFAFHKYVHEDSDLFIAWREEESAETVKLVSGTSIPPGQQSSMVIPDIQDALLPVLLRHLVEEAGHLVSKSGHRVFLVIRLRPVFWWQHGTDSKEVLVLEAGSSALHGYMVADIYTLAAFFNGFPRKFARPGNNESIQSPSGLLLLQYELCHCQSVEPFTGSQNILT